METSTGSTTNITESLISEASDLMQRHHLSDAEKLYQEALQKLADDDDSTCQAYLGLAQIYSKRGRYCRGDENEWHRYYLQALTMHRNALKAAKKDSDLTQISQHMNMVQDMYIDTLKLRLIPPPPLCPHLPPSYKSNRKIPLNSQWLNGLQTHIKNKLASPSACLSPVPSVSSSEEFKSEIESEPTKKNKLDFNRVRKAIMRMVKQISKDMRARHVRKHLPEHTLKRAVSSEMLCMLTPQNENMDVLSLFESYIIDETPEFNLPGSEVEEHSHKSSSTDSEEYSSEDNVINNDPSTKNGGSARPHSLPSAINSANKLWHNSPQKSISLVTEGCIQATRSPLSTKPCTVYGNRKTAKMSGNESELKLPGVLRVWYGHKQKHSPIHNFFPHKLHFEEMSPLTETGRYRFEDIIENEHENKPVTEQKINVTLAVILSKIGDILTNDDQLDYANELYTHALGIFQANEHCIPAHEFLSIAHLLKSLGAIRCAKGDFIGGSQLMEEAVDMYRKYHNNDENIDVISVWYELGRAYMSEQCNEDNFLEYVMSAVKDHIDNNIDVNDDHVDYTSDSDETDSSSGDSYTLHVHEAKCFLNHALQMLRNLRRKKELHNELYVSVISKMADCCIMLGDYHKATLCYEEALVLFKSIIGSHSIALNAHVLAMLGVSNFLLGNYPKANRMLETAHILQQHLNGRSAKFQMAFTLTMLGISNDIVGRYDKCVAWCMKAHELYSSIFRDISQATSLQLWFMIQTVYTLGYAYSSLHLCDKALQYLDISQKMVLRNNAPDVKHIQQIVHIVKLMADVYAIMEQPEKALFHYDEALTYAQKLGDEENASTLQNQLLNRMAGVHVTTKDYNTAAKCLEQALDYQKNMQSSIKGDMFGMMHSLGLTYTLSGDIDKAIDCYKDAIEAYHEMHGASPGPDLAEVYGRIATLYHVKACLEDEEEDILELNMLVDKYYNDALALDYCSPIVVQQANFLYQQGLTADALLIMLAFLWRTSSCNYEDIIMYNGPEQAVLPIHLQQDLDDVDEVILSAKIFGHFLAILCYKELNLMKDAEDSLVHLYKLVFCTYTSINYSILGYSLMEMDLFEEAVEMFFIAFEMDNEASNAYYNYLMCFATAAYRVLYRGIYNIWEKYYFEVALFIPNTVPIKSSYNASTCTYTNTVCSESIYPTRDSGYYDSAESTAFKKLTSSSLTSPTEENIGIIDFISHESKDPGYTSLESLQLHSPSVENHKGNKMDHHSQMIDQIREKEQEAQPGFNNEVSFDENSNLGEERTVTDDKNNEWFETVVETPIEILNILKSQAKQNDSDIFSIEKHEVEEQELVGQQHKKQRVDGYSGQAGSSFTVDSLKSEKEDLNKAKRQSKSSYKDDIWYARNYLSDNFESESYHSSTKQEPLFKDKNKEYQDHPLDQTIQDLQHIAEESMDISPQNYTETWDDVTGQWTRSDTIDDLLKHSRELEHELEESLRTIESHTKNSGSNPEMKGWRAATSTRTQEILASIQNNNNSASSNITSGSDNRLTQEYVQDEEANDIQDEEIQVWDEEEVVDTPPAILAFLKSQAALKQ